MRKYYKSAIVCNIIASILGGIGLLIAGIAILKNYDDYTRILGIIFIIATALAFISVPFTIRRAKRNLKE